YYIKRDAFPYFREEYDRSEIEFTVFPRLVEARKVAPYHEDGVFWHSVDGLKDLEAVREEYENREDKPWGYERIIVNNPKYLVKELYIKKDYRTSVHYHPRKDESMHVLSGEGYIDVPKEKKRIPMRAGGVVQIEPNRTHSIVATENLRIYEYSTPHPKDSVRVKDFYER
ncbi:MAG: cupin domain-containing protein, partial [Candidatus Hydrothermarchaeaceae archaeon]